MNVCLCVCVYVSSLTLALESHEVLDSHHQLLLGLICVSCQMSFF
jgi:hypothetical protein